MSARILMTGFACLVGLSLFALTPPARATSLGKTTFGRFISDADLIVIGTVARVIDVPAGEVGGSVRVAEVEVVEWFRGIERPKRVWYLAEGLVDADHSTAVKGEKALFFLYEPKGPLYVEGDIEKRLESPVFREQLSKMTGGAPMHHLCFMGRGRMLLEKIEDVEYLNLETWLISLPPNARTIPGPDPRIAELDRRVRFDYVRRLIRGRLTPLEPPSGEAAATVFKFLEALETDIGKAEELAEELDKEEMVPILLKLLEDPAFPRRDAVAEALIWVEGHEPTSLLEELASENVVRRRAAAFALDAGVKLELVGPDEPVIEAVRVAVSDSDPEVRAYATGMLMRMYELDLLAAAFSDESFRVRASARQSLLHFPEQTEEEDFPFAKAETALIAYATDESVHVRREVWELLGYIAGPSSRLATLKALADADRVVRVGAVRALGRLGEAKRLIELLASKDVWIRRVAVYTLGLAQIAAGVGPLADALDDSDELVVGLAIEALGEIGPPAVSAVPALEALLKGPGGNHWRSGVEYALKRIRK